MNTRIDIELEDALEERQRHLKKANRGYRKQHAVADAITLWLEETELSVSDQALIQQIRKALAAAPEASEIRVLLEGIIANHAGTANQPATPLRSARAAKGAGGARPPVGRKTR